LSPRQCLKRHLNLIIYRVDEEANKVVLIALMDSRQSIEPLLYETMLVL
jgi:hypothetical protein